MPHPCGEPISQWNLGTSPTSQAWLKKETQTRTHTFTSSLIGYKSMLYTYMLLTGGKDSTKHLFKYFSSSRVQRVVAISDFYLLRFQDWNLKMTFFQRPDLHRKHSLDWFQNSSCQKIKVNRNLSNMYVRQNIWIHATKHRIHSTIQEKTIRDVQSRKWQRNSLMKYHLTIRKNSSSYFCHSSETIGVL